MNIEDSNYEIKIEEIDNNHESITESISDQFKRSKEEQKYKKT